MTAKSVLDRIRDVIEVTSFGAPASAELMAEVEQSLGVALPEWLREIYSACNGFCGPTNVGYLYALDGTEGVQEFTLFLRAQGASPPWIHRAIIFGDDGGGGSTTNHWAALDGSLIHWCYGDGAEFTVLENDLFAVWRREQKLWDEARSSME